MPREYKLTRDITPTHRDRTAPHRYAYTQYPDLRLIQSVRFEVGGTVIDEWEQRDGELVQVRPS